MVKEPTLTSHFTVLSIWATKSTSTDELMLAAMKTKESNNSGWGACTDKN